MAFRNTSNPGTLDNSPTGLSNMQPTTFLIALFPGFQLMDLAGPLDILNLLSLPPFSAPISMRFIAESLDPVAVKPPDTISYATPQPDQYDGNRYAIRFPPDTSDGTITSSSKIAPFDLNRDFNQSLTPDLTFQQYLYAISNQPSTGPADILLIPGGLGTRMVRIPISPTAQNVDEAVSQTLSQSSGPDGSGNFTSNVQALQDFVLAAAPTLKQGVITVCTGSDVLARTGLLNGKRATTNLTRFQYVKSKNPLVNWIWGARWVKSLISIVPSRPTAVELATGIPTSDSNNNHEEEGKEKQLEVWSSAGISAGMDVTLAWIAEKYGGMDVSRALARLIEYDWREMQEGEVDEIYYEFYGGEDGKGPGKSQQQQQQTKENVGFGKGSGQVERMKRVLDIGAPHFN